MRTRSRPNWQTSFIGAYVVQKTLNHDPCMSEALPVPPVPALVQDADRLHELRELDAKVAECVLGKHVARDSGGDVLEFYGEYPHGFYATPKGYSSSWSAIRLVEDEIERRGLGREYLWNLTEVAIGVGSPTELLWRTFRASCEQRCKAALSVCGALHDRRTDA